MTQHRTEAGTGLVELVVAMGIFMIVLGAATVGVRSLSAQSTTLERQTVALDQLQTAQEAIVRDLHGAKAWCAVPTAGAASTLTFTASLPSSPVVLIVASGTPVVLKIETATACAGPFTIVDEVSGLNTANIFTVPAAAGWTGTINVTPYSYFTSMSMTLTLNSTAPAGTAQKTIQTVLSDPSIELWPLEYTCQNSWNNDPGAGTDPC